MPRHPPSALSSLTIKFTRGLLAPRANLTALAQLFVSARPNSRACERTTVHIRLSKTTQLLLARHEDAQNSTLTCNRLNDCFECSTSGGSPDQPIWRVSFSCPARRAGCPDPKDRKNLVEARGFEPLTSGLQSPRSAKLSYAPSRAGIEGWLRGRDLNPRPLGYEPNELPDCSTPRHPNNHHSL